MTRRGEALRLVIGLLFLAAVVLAVLVVIALASRTWWVVGSVLAVALYVYACHIVGDELVKWWQAVGRDRTIRLMDRLPLLPAASKATPPVDRMPDDLLVGRYCARCAEPANGWRAAEVKPHLWQAVPLCPAHLLDADLAPFGRDHGA